MRSRYSALIFKLLLRISISLLLSALVGFAVIYLFVETGMFADLFVEVCNILGFSYRKANILYYEIIQRNREIIVVLGFISLFLLFMFWFIRAFIVYMGYIEQAVEDVFRENELLINLPNELKPLETKLNSIKYRLKQREFEAKEAQQQKNDLVAYLAHDLKTPLTSILGYSSLLEEADTLPPEVSKKYVSIIRNKADRMAWLLEELFEITRYNAQNISLCKREVNLNMILEQLAEEFYPLLQEKNLVLSLKMVPGCRLQADGEQLARVFDNLLRNAVSYSQLGSEIIIEMTLSEQKLEVSFHNYGVTLPADKLSRIFEKFYRANEARSSSQGGSGLGLAIAKKIVELHGGEITAHSADLWTTFTVTLEGYLAKELVVAQSL